MTQLQFMTRVMALGGSPREAELIAANVFNGWWMEQLATKITREQREAIAVLLMDRRDEDEVNARIDNDVRNLKEKNNVFTGESVQSRA